MIIPQGGLAMSRDLWLHYLELEVTSVRFKTLWKRSKDRRRWGRRTASQKALGGTWQLAWAGG